MTRSPMGTERYDCHGCDECVRAKRGLIARVDYHSTESDRRLLTWAAVAIVLAIVVGVGIALTWAG
jgi:hypothetical protein